MGTGKGAGADEDTTDLSEFDDVLEEARYLLQEWAVKASDEEEWRSYLENVAAHQEIAGAYAGGEYARGEYPLWE